LSRARLATLPRLPWRELLTGLALAAGATTTPAAAPAQESAALEAEVRRLVGSATCTADEQCRTLAFGAKACGGPQAYIAWSTLVTDAAALQAVADKHAARRRDELRKSGMVSDCALVVDPGATCAPIAAASAPAMRSCRLLGGASGTRNAR
jgi:hypothetical protein